MKPVSCLVFLLYMVWGCSPAQRIGRTARQTVLRNSSLASAHVGISIFDPQANKHLFNHQADKYFVPASNTKILTCYAALKHLGERLKGIKYQEGENNTVIVEPTGDPTLLHPLFPQQPVLEFLRSKQHVLINTQNWQEEGWGNGWSWNDYNGAYMAERSALPLYGNVAQFEKKAIAGTSGPEISRRLTVVPRLFEDSLYLSDELGYLIDSVAVERSLAANRFALVPATKEFTRQEVPFTHAGFHTTRRLLRDTLKNDVRTAYFTLDQPRVLYSQPADSVLRPMMHESDNFLAEQLLLMVSGEMLGVLNNKKVIDTLLKTDLAGLPQQPRWVDGSGLSRYNLFTPHDFVFLLNRMQQEFGMERLKVIFPAGGEGTLKNYYTADSTSLFAKTGTLSGVVSLSGFMYTKKKRLLLFSVLVNNHQAAPTEVRRAIEQFLQTVKKRS